VEDIEREIARQVAHQASADWRFSAIEDGESSRLIGDCGLQPL